MSAEKSHVGMECRICLVCCKEYETGAILLDRRLKNSLERHTITGWGLCTEHDIEDAVHLIGCKNSHSGDVMQPNDADRTGEVATIKLEAFLRVFNVPPPKGRVTFVEQGVIELLKGKQENANE